MISFLVVLYNKNISESKTLASLVNLIGENVNLVIVNNGPHKLPDYYNDRLYKILVMKFSSVTITEYLHNAPLSVIYNGFIKSNSGADAFVIFDDDSEVPRNYIHKIKNSPHYSDLDVIVPRIFSQKDNSFHYPQLKGDVIDEERMLNAKEVCELISIGSGLIILQKLIGKFESLGFNLFDERFALYGVDYSFFRLLKEIAKHNNVAVEVNGVLQHDLSSGSNMQEPWRIRERLIDHVLCAKYYSPSKITSFYRISKIIIKEVFHRRYINTPLVLKVYFKGKHPRC